MTSTKTIAALSLISVGMQGQETPGLLFSNYFVSSAFAINPSASADAKTFIQYNVLAADAYVGTNLLFLPNYKVSISSLKNTVQPQLGINLSKTPKFAAAMASAEGPAFTFSKNNIGFGLFVRARAEADFKLGSMVTAASLLVQDLQNSGTTSINLRNSRAAAMAWTEVGANAAYQLQKTRKSTLSVGVNIKAIAGAGYAYANLKQFTGFYNDSLIQVNNLNATYRYTTLNYNLGKGLGLDLGLTYKRMSGNPCNYFANSVRCNCEQMDYKYKLSVSLHDVGLVRFKNANAGNYQTSGTFFTNQNDTSYLAQLSEIETLQPIQKSIWTSLPTELVSQFDYNFGNKLFISAGLIKNLLPAGLSGVRGSNLLQLAPRFETKQLEFSLPLSFIDFKKPVTGAFIRMYGFGLGIDNLAAVLYKSDLSKAGLYFKWTLSLYKNPACKPKKYKLVECPTKLLNLKK